MRNYILVPHFYRLNWAREMSEFLRKAVGFEYIGQNFQYGNYSKATELRNEYLNYLLDNSSKYKGRTLFFVNLNDYIFFEKRKQLRDIFNIHGFMRGSRFFDGEPGNSNFSKDDLSKMQQIEAEGLAETEKIFLGSQAFCCFLQKKIKGLEEQKINVVGIPIFQEPYWMNKSQDEINKFNLEKIKGSILWNHRLQKQKNPWVLFELETFVKKNITVCAPEALSAAYSKEMKEHESIFRKIIRDNGKRRQNYLNELKCAQFVFSTSEHETWGNSMMEAIMNGAVPFAPDGELCSYKELFPAEFLYPQALIKKEKNIITRNDNMIQLSYLIDDFVNKNHFEQLLELQQNLWNKFNKDEWIKKLF